MVQLYLEGRLELAAVAAQVGSSPADLAASFESQQFIRSAATLRLSDEQRLQLAAKVADRRGHTPNLMAREVIASQRIEGIDARRHFNTLP